ncbi:MAG: Amuc_1100 family pilus-like protein [bacterium]
MKSKGKIALTSLIAVASVMICAVGAMLFFERSKLRAAEGRMDVDIRRLTNSMAFFPFPSAGNIEATRTNVQALEDDAALLRKEMNAGQITVEDGIEPLTWRALLTKRKKDLQDEARASNVSLPLQFSFGFQKYDNGTSPKNRSDVKRLTLQLKTVEQLCTVIFKSGASAIESLARDEFEEGGVVMSHGSAAGSETTGKEPALFTREHFTVGLKAKEDALVSLLNNLAACRMFTVVSFVRITGNPGVELRSAGKVGDNSPEHEAKSATKSATTDGSPRSERIITGRGKEQASEVLLELDVYEFGVPAKEAVQ